MGNDATAISFWPEGFDINDTRSPMEILAIAQAEWKEKSGGLLELEVRIDDLETFCGFPVIRVFLCRDHLFRIEQNIYNNSNGEYPVAITSVTSPALYCHNPLNFEEKLSQLLKSGAVKTTVVNALIKIKAETASAAAGLQDQSININ
jgi:hypothetical protein